MMKQTNSEELLWQVEHELAHKERIRKTVPQTKPVRESIGWQRVLTPLAASLVLLATVVFAIPSARAEVLSWFGITRPEQYLTQDPSERTPNEALDNMIVSTTPENSHVVITPAQNEPNAVNSSAALTLAKQLQSDFSATLGETMFDGNEAYVKLQLTGYGALPILEKYTGGSNTSVPVDANRVLDLHGTLDPEYLNGEKIWYERPETTVILTFEDGTEQVGHLSLADSETFHTVRQQMRDKGLSGDALNMEQQQKLNALLLQIVQEKGVDTVAEFLDAKTNLERNIDANGFALARVTLRIDVIEDAEKLDTLLLEAELGTVTFNVSGYQKMETQNVVGGDSVVWQGETVLTANHFVWDDRENEIGHFELKNTTVSLNDMKLRAMEGAYKDALGVHKLRVAIELPESMPTEWKQALIQSPPNNPLDFKIFVNGEAGGYSYGGYFGFAAADGKDGQAFPLEPALIDEDGVAVFEIGSINGIPLEHLAEVKTITLVPVIRYGRAVLFYQNGQPTGEQPIPFDDLYVLNDTGITLDYVREEYPQFAVTFTLE